MKLHSVRFKISILYTVILGAILIAYSALLYVNLSYVVFHEIDKKLWEIGLTLTRENQATGGMDNVRLTNKDSFDISNQIG